MPDPSISNKKLVAILAWAVPLCLTAIWFYVQLQVWKEEGHDHMLTVANFIVTALLWAALVWAAYKNFTDARRATLLQSEIVTIKDEAKLQLDSLNEFHASELARLGKVNNSELWRISEGRSQVEEELRSLKEKLSLSPPVRESQPEVSDLRPALQEAGAQAGLLWYFSGQAKQIATRLEGAWYHWHNVGEKLVHPLAAKAEITNWDADYTMELLNELRDFQVLFQTHLNDVNRAVPEFSSNATSYESVSACEYPVVLSDIQAHAESLDNAARQVWNSGYVLSAERAQP